MTPQQVITAEFSAVVVDRPVYTIGSQLIAHPVLVESVPAVLTDEGDSGSPVVSEDGSTLLGMLVAGGNGTDTTGRRTRMAYFIPASDLFDPTRYTGLAGPEVWTLA